MGKASTATIPMPLDTTAVTATKPGDPVDLVPTATTPTTPDTTGGADTGQEGALTGLDASEPVTLVAAVNIPRSMIADADNTHNTGRIETGETFEVDAARAERLIAIGYATDPNAAEEPTA